MLKNILIGLLLLNVSISNLQAKELPKNIIKNTEKKDDAKKAEQSSNLYKLNFIVKKAGKVVIEHPSSISLNDTDNQSKLGKVIFVPQQISQNGVPYTVGLSLFMKLVYIDNKYQLGIIGSYTDPNVLIDVSDKFKKDANLTPSIISAKNIPLPNNKSTTVNMAEFFKVYELSNPNGDETNFTKFVIKEPNGNANLIEISFKVNEFKDLNKK